MSIEFTYAHAATQSRMLGLCFGALAVLGVLGVLGACDDTEETFKRRNNPQNDPNAPRCTDVGAAYVGFAGTKLEDKRVNAVVGADRVRIKPYSAMKGEYERTIGVVPGSLEQAAPSFGNPPDRFASEPRASAIQLYSAFRVGFDGCLQYVGKKTELSSAPTAESAKSQCTTMARTFWSRSPTNEEVEACSQVALKDSATETDPKRRWAYTCATLLSSAGFLTY